MYELFILGELMDDSMHGYLLRDILNLAMGPLRQLSWGALYPLLRRLEADSLIEQVSDSEATGERPRKVYRITAAGRERFFFLLLRPEEYTPDTPDLFNIKLTNFDHLNPSQRHNLLLHYKGYLHYMQAQLTNSRRFVTAEPHIREHERPWVLNTLAHRLHLLAADIAWVEEMESELGRAALDQIEPTEISGN